jgi:hypothetical protein
LFVVHDEAETIRRTMLQGLEVPFPVLLDHDRSSYAAWGLGRATWWRVYLDPQVWRQYARLLRQGEKWRGSGGDTLQLGGDFVVSPQGRIVYSRPQRADDRPPVGLLVKALEEAAGPAGSVAMLDEPR